MAAFARIWRAQSIALSFHALTTVATGGGGQSLGLSVDEFGELL